MPVGTKSGQLAGAALLGLAGLAGAAVFAGLRRPLPRTSGSLKLAGLRAPVQVLRDRWGVPHIYAASSADLFMAQGYIHAQDRLWQMELQRRTGHGRLSELFGGLALDTDRYVRIMGFSRVAERELATLAGDSRAAIEAYIAGVNAFIERNARRLPLEFTLLRIQPEQWRPADVLVWGKMLAQNLARSWISEALRAQIVALVGPERASALEPEYLADHPLTLPRGASYGSSIGADALRMVSNATPFMGNGELGQGSNAWVVGGGRSASGRPLLANDVHLTLQVPSLWYENHLSGGEFHVTGASLPGTPGVVIGHNERVAWGVTNGENDVQDLFIERFDRVDRLRYQFRGEWQRAELVREEIRIKGRAAPHVEEVRITRHGPVISALVPAHAPTKDQQEQQGGDTTAYSEELALRWTALEPGQTLDA